MGARNAQTLKSPSAASQHIQKSCSWAFALPVLVKMMEQTFSPSWGVYIEKTYLSRSLLGEIRVKSCSTRTFELDFLPAFYYLLEEPVFLHGLYEY